MHGELLALSLVLAAALLGGRFAVRLGYPSILGELIAGMVIGPPALGLVQSSEMLTILGEAGVLLMMLYIGMHLDIGDLRKASRPGLMAAVGGFVVPAGAGFALMAMTGHTVLEALFVGLAMGVTSLATKSRILVDLRILDTRVAHVLMAAALISDLTVLVVFASVVGPEGGVAGGFTWAMAGVAGLKAVGFGLVAALIGLFLIPRVAGLLGKLERGGAFLSVVVVGVLFGWAAELAGLHSILGAFMAGLFLSERTMGIRLSRDVQRMLATVSVGTLAPIFFVTAGFQVRFSVFQTDLLLVLAVVVVATLGKILGTTLFYMIGGQPWREGIVVGGGMNGRGAVEIIVAEIALVQGVIDQDVFSILVFMAIITTATVPILLTKGVQWLRRRGELVKAGSREGTIIIGAGPVARELGTVLAEVEPVTLVDTNRANLAAGRRMGMLTVFGSALEEQTLLTAGIEHAARLIALTPNNEVNVLAAQLASGHGVGEVAMLVTDAQANSFESILDQDGVHRLFPGEMDLMTWDYELSAGIASRHETVVEEETPDQLRRATHDILPLAVVRGSEVLPFVGDLGKGDRVVFVSNDRRAAEAPPKMDTSV